jgi:hypothetical protein
MSGSSGGTVGGPAGGVGGLSPEGSWALTWLSVAMNNSIIMNNKLNANSNRFILLLIILIDWQN